MNFLVQALMFPEDVNQKLFARGEGFVTVRDVRRMAARVVTRMRAIDGPVFLHTHSAAHFTAGLLAAASLDKQIALPAHTQPAYLAEIGCNESALITDEAFDDAEETSINAVADDPLLIFFTSGSTGAPKPVEKNLSRLNTEARGLEALWGGEARHVIATVSHQHIYGMLFRIAWPLLSGRTGDDWAAIYWEDLEDRFDGATLITSPAHLTRLPPRTDLFAPPPGLIFSSGQALSTDAAHDTARAFGKPAIEVLGSTETGGIAWRRQTETSLWTPFAGIDITSGEENALIVRSPYLQTDAPQHTGDVVEVHDDGRFKLLPRGDRIAKIDGKRVSLTRVEDALQALADIESVAALTLPARNDALAAIAVLTPAGKAQLQTLGAFRLSRHLRAAGAATLEPAERPKHWRFVESIPTNSQGKRVLSDLRAQFASSDPLDVLDLEIRRPTEDSAEISFTLPRELVFFEGHFPDRAILPGVAQAHLAVLLAQKLWGDWPSDSNLARLKFRRVLFPGDHVVLKLKHDPKIGRVSFVYMFGEIDASQGDIGGFKR